VGGVRSRMAYVTVRVVGGVRSRMAYVTVRVVGGVRSRMAYVTMRVVAEKHKNHTVIGLLVCDAVYSYRQTLTFRRNLLPPTSGSK